MIATPLLKFWLQTFRNQIDLLSPFFWIAQDARQCAFGPNNLPLT
jgi:hypothetical protein